MSNSVTAKALFELGVTPWFECKISLISTTKSESRKKIFSIIN